MLVGEPSLDELLREPIVQLVMRADRIKEQDLRFAFAQLLAEVTRSTASRSPSINAMGASQSTAGSPVSRDAPNNLGSSERRPR